MEEIPFQNSVRTEWRAESRTLLVNSLLGYFPQITDEERRQIFEDLSSSMLDYLELAHYKGLDDPDPRWILVFDRKNIYLDVLDPADENAVVSEIKTVSGGHGRFLRSRPVLNSEWTKRIEVLLGFDPKQTLRPGETIPELNYHKVKFIQDELEAVGDSKFKYLSNFNISNFDDSDSDSDYDDSADDDYDEAYPNQVSVSQEGVLDRVGFKILAKQPFVDWLNEIERKTDIPASCEKTVWTLQKVNEEPPIFLSQVGMELMPKAAQTRKWNEIKKKVIREFLCSYYTDESQFPKIKPKDFEKWFTIKQMGMIFDLENID